MRQRGSGPLGALSIGAVRLITIERRLHSGEEAYLSANGETHGGARENFACKTEGVGLIGAGSEKKKAKGRADRNGEKKKFSSPLLEGGKGRRIVAQACEREKICLREGLAGPGLERKIKGEKVWRKGSLRAISLKRKKRGGAAKKLSTR